MAVHRFSLCLRPKPAGWLVLSLALAPCLAPLQAAHAQLSMGGGQGGGGGGDDAASAEASATAKANAPPPALPGAVSSDPDAPTSHAPLDVNPTTALFDAIDRGDLTAAKDALSRGAELQATNVLGQTPIDMSIDLSRNDITFLLLSMRNADQGGGAQLAQVNVQAGGVDRVGHLAISAHGTHPVERASYAVSPEAAAGGVAKPEIGFLGFGGT
ncbi:ankyrin repeat domain-containing protein [Lichenicoccus sp.]|uniref:ankyrin repeat domain-containing protein n=1 Tax=Lichenicoccus sp. TaxID=2781899 RepID=UPI003D11A9B1